MPASPADVNPQIDTIKETPASPPAGGLAATDSVGQEPVVDMPEGDASSTNGSGLFANEIVALAVLFCSSTITMIAAARECDVPTLHVGETDPKCEGPRAWAVACSIISMFIVAFHMATSRFAESLHKKTTWGIAVFLLIWWICGVGAGTFDKPFKTFSNGYISEWICFFASLYYCALVIPKLGELFARAEESVAARQSTQYAALLVLLGFIVFLASLVECNETGKECDSEYIYAVVASIGSMLFAGLFIPFHARCNETMTKYFGFFLLLWWAAAAGTFTFDKPFKVAGNGWFASWGSFVLSLVFTLDAGGYITNGTGDVAPSDADPATKEEPAHDPENPNSDTAEA